MNDNLAGEAAHIDREAAALSGEFIPRGERTGGESEPTPPQSKTVLFCVQVMKHLQKFAPLWAISDFECAMQGQATGDLIDHYFPDIDLGPALSFLISSAVVFGPRLGTPMRPEPEPEPPVGTVADDAPAQ